MYKKFWIKTLSPIWTGDIEGNCKNLKVSGIKGSLRWWTEILFRGLGLSVCNCTSDKKCSYDNKNENICEVCKLFGCTGWASRFSLNVEGGETLNVIKNKRGLNIQSMHGNNQRNRGWYLNDGIIGDEIKFKFNDLYGFNSYYQKIILIILRLISRWGGIGAKTQLGYGTIKLFKKSKLDFDENELFDIETGNENYNNYPSLKNMFFIKVPIKNLDNLVKRQCEQNFDFDRLLEKNSEKNKLLKYVKQTKCIPSAYSVKDTLRYKDRLQVFPNISRKIGETNEEQDFFGTTKGKAIKSKINISSAYKRIIKSKDNKNKERYEMRMWGWYPEEQFKDISREKLLNQLKNKFQSTEFWDEVFYNKLKDTFSLVNNNNITWREFNSNRDTKGKYTDILDFLKTL